MEQDPSVASTVATIPTDCSAGTSVALETESTLPLLEGTSQGTTTQETHQLPPVAGSLGFSTIDVPGGLGSGSSELANGQDAVPVALGNGHVWSGAAPSLPVEADDDEPMDITADDSIMESSPLASLVPPNLASPPPACDDEPDNEGSLEGGELPCSPVESPPRQATELDLMFSDDDGDDDGDDTEGKGNNVEDTGQSDIAGADSHVPDIDGGASSALTTVAEPEGDASSPHFSGSPIVPGKAM